MNIDSKFGKDILKGTGVFTVPNDYNDDTWLDDFRNKTCDLESTQYFNPNLRSENFANLKNKLVPCKTYGLKLFRILEKASTQECLMFLKENKAILVGPRGLTLLQSYQPEIFIIWKCTASFDEKNLLDQQDNTYGVPFILRLSGNEWNFNLSSIEDNWQSLTVLICFHELE